MWSTYIAVADVDQSVAVVGAAGGRVLLPPFDMPDAGRAAIVVDPAGTEFGLWQAKERIRCQVSQLDPNGDDSGFWRMPGYGDFLERRDPQVRERQAEVGAPEGFEDAVAWLVPMSGEQADQEGPRWSVTFAVDDADAIAERAAELGGTVLAPPFDSPWVRMAVISDPQGRRSRRADSCPNSTYQADDADVAAEPARARIGPVTR